MENQVENQVGQKEGPIEEIRKGSERGVCMQISPIIVTLQYNDA